MAGVASEPRFRWFGRWTARATGRCAATPRARPRAAGAVPLMVVMRHQGKGCGGGYTAGGPAEDRRTRAWYHGSRAASATREW